MIEDGADVTGALVRGSVVSNERNKIIGTIYYNFQLLTRNFLCLYSYIQASDNTINL
mgnify:CR=1 FL=1